MQIAHIAPPWISIPPENYGGTEVVLHNLVEEQVAQGHDVTLLAPGDARSSARVVSFFPHSLSKTETPWGAHLKAFYHLYKSVEYIKAHEFDIIHMHLSSAADMYLFPLVAGLKTSQVMTLHSRFPFDRIDTWKGDADSLYMEWARSVPIVAVSRYAREEVLHPLNFVGVVPHGLPIRCFEATVSEPEEYFAWLGRIVPDKGTHLAIQAAREANVPLILAGTVDQHLPEAVQYFETQVKPYIDGKQIKYIGPVNLEQKIDLFSRARGFLNSIMWEEPFGMVIIESMAVGCPVISFTRGGVAEIIKHKKNGFLVYDVQEMVHYIKRIDELDRAEICAGAKIDFSVHAMAEKYIHIYKSIIAARMRATMVRPALRSAGASIVSLQPPDPTISTETRNLLG